MVSQAGVGLGEGIDESLCPGSNSESIPACKLEPAISLQSFGANAGLIQASSPDPTTLQKAPADGMDFTSVGRCVAAQRIDFSRMISKRSRRLKGVLPNHTAIAGWLSQARPTAVFQSRVECPWLPLAMSERNGSIFNVVAIGLTTYCVANVTAQKITGPRSTTEINR